MAVHLGGRGPGHIDRAAAVPFPGAALGMDFVNSLYQVGNSRYGSFLAMPGAAFTRASSKYAATSGGVLVLFGPGVPAITDQGVLIEEARTNLFLNSFAPGTQTITLSATGNYTVSVWGTGSVAVAAGTATITNAGSASDGSPRTINCTATGTISVTVTGAPTAVQVEAGAFGTSPIQTAGTSATRAADSMSLTGSWARGLTIVTRESGGQWVSSGPFPKLSALGDGTNTLQLAIDTGSGTAAISGTSLSTPDVGAAVVSGGVQIIAASLSSAGAVRASAGGSAVVAVTGSSPLITATTLMVGDQIGGSRSINGYVSKLRLFSTAVSDAQLQSYSTGN